MVYFKNISEKGHKLKTVKSYLEYYVVKKKSKVKLSQ